MSPDDTRAEDQARHEMAELIVRGCQSYFVMRGIPFTRDYLRETTVLIRAEIRSGSTKAMADRHMAALAEAPEEMKFWIAESLKLAFREIGVRAARRVLGKKP